MKAVAQRIRALRDSISVPQTKLAELSGSTQSSINRYENEQSDPSLELLLWYADYFDVSLDYIFCRTDNPQGGLYGNDSPALKERMADKEEWQQFVEACFDPKSPMSAKLKEMMLKMTMES